MSEAIGIVIMLIGLAFNVLGCVGLVRLPDVYNRLQASTKCVTLGTCLVLVSVMILAGGSGALICKAFLCLLFILITSPTAAHALAKGAHASGVKLWKESVTDRYAEDGEPETVQQEEDAS